MKMFKKILFVIMLLFPLSSFAFSTPVEKVFKDIDKDYKYYNELQTLYDKGMFFPDENGNFNPKKLLSREEFIGVVSEVSCKKCIQPNVGYDFFSKYNNSKSFFDVKKENKYFYCVASALDLGQIKGYYKGDSCEDGTSRVGEAPFCPKNTIILEEALAIMLRVSNIFSNSEADAKRQQILSGTKFPDLSSDVKAKLPGGGVYSFYPDFRVALNYEIFEYDNSGNKKTYKLLEKVGNKLNPKKAISKEEFLKMAYVLLKGNSCIENNFYNLGLKIKIFNKSCNKKIKARCSLSKLRGKERVYDFSGDIGFNSWDEKSKSMKYTWRFYNFSTGEEFVEYGDYLDNYKFLKPGKYRVYLTVKDDNGNFGEVYNDINIATLKSAIDTSLGENLDNNEKNTNSDLKVSIDANPISSNVSTKINFRGIVSGSDNIESYFWEYGDSESSYGLNNTHIYKEPGNYQVKFSVIDSDGNKNTSTVLINSYDDKTDSDGDSVSDFEDYEKYTKKENIGSICTKEDIELSLYGCEKEDLGVYNPEKKNVDTDGDFVFDSEDYEKNTKKENIGSICTKLDILLSLYGCEEEDLGVYNPKKKEVDGDSDGVLDYKDLCPFTFGLIENSGCPEVSDSDSDGDGVLDNLDACINIPGAPSNSGCPVKNELIGEDGNLGGEDSDGDFVSDSEDYEKNTKKENIGSICTKEDIELSLYGCEEEDLGVYNPKKKEVDGDSDGVPDYKDLCPFTFGLIENSGCPEVSDSDSDGDGVLDNLDACINIPGAPSNNGCPVKNELIGEDGNLGDSFDVEDILKSDSDLDGVLDSFDACIGLKGLKENYGCPIFENTCSLSLDCPDGYACFGGFCKLKSFVKNCEYSGGDIFYGNVICDTCPCKYSIDFSSTIRKCDIIFPAITSPDETEIYSKGDYYRVEK